MPAADKMLGRENPPTANVMGRITGWVTKEDAVGIQTQGDVGNGKGRVRLHLAAYLRNARNGLSIVGFGGDFLIKKEKGQRGKNAFGFSTGLILCFKMVSMNNANSPLCHHVTLNSTRLFIAAKVFSEG